jgi:hypothetical protein
MILTRKELALTLFSCLTVAFTANLYAAESAETIKTNCSKTATEKTGHDPAKAASSGSTTGKTAAGGALAGTAVRAAQGKDNLAKGAVIGGAVGGGVGARRSKKGQQKAADSQEAYQTQYNSCLKENGL